MGQRKVLAGSCGLALVALAAVSCGKSSKAPGELGGGGQGGQANGYPGDGGASTAAQAGAAAEAARGGGGFAGEAPSGIAGEPVGGAAVAGAGAGGTGEGGAAGSDGCVYDGKQHAVGEHFPSLEYWDVCECQSGGEVSCFQGCGGWLTTESYRLIDEARECEEATDCQVLKSVDLPFTGPFVGFFNEAKLGALDGLEELADLHAQLDCDAPITPPKERIPPTLAYCTQGRCQDHWTGLNLLKNGGFEDVASDVPTSWTLTPALAFSLQAQARTGDAALAVTLSDAAVTYRLASGVALPALVSSHTLTVSGYYWVDRVDSELALTLTLDGSAGNDPSYAVPAPTSAGVWQAFTLEGLSYAFSSSVSVGFGVRLVNGSTTTIAFDDLVVEETTGR